MLFNSLEFLIFLPIVFLLYWFVFPKNLKIQNTFLLIASYYFYSCWDWRFTFLLLFSTLLDFFTGLKMENSRKNRKIWFWLSVTINLGFLGIFKYYNFFIDSLSKLLAQFGFQSNPYFLEIILPVGISFYTFHGLSYVIDIYKEKITPEKNFIDYALFVSFFPLLVAGPIERATHLLPQIKKNRIFEYSNAVIGLRQILWGLFKKMVIADNCAVFANEAFNNPTDLNSSTLLLGAVFFAFQIYGDFSGYSDIALGVARLFGFELLKNFAFPYFSRDIAEFWRRWHISLSTWFKDYLYIPLGGSKGGNWMRARNTFIIFLVSGFWHGANWTFIVWGFLNALFIMPSILLKTNRNNLEIVAQGRLLPSVKEIAQISLTFTLTVLTWIFFRADSLQHAIFYISKLFSFSLTQYPQFSKMDKVFTSLILVLFLMIVEWFGRENKFALEKMPKSWSKLSRYLFYLMLVFLLLMYLVTEETPFIYFEF